jgi:EAL and modified HD-GYP domain-containing signal transduction protein
MENELIFTINTICNNKMKSIGYQLSFVNPDASEGIYAKIPELLTVEALAEIFSEEHLSAILEESFVIVNFSEAMLSTPIGYSLPSDNLVIGVDSKYLQFSEEMLSILSDLRKSGYKIAVSYRAGADNMGSYLKIADIIMIDIKNTNNNDLHTVVSKLLSPTVSLYAKNIDTHEKYNICHSLGCKYFDGNFITTPHLGVKGKVTSDRLITMRLLVELDNEKVTLKRIEELLSQDSRLSYRVLREVNSVFYGLPRPVNSIREAVIMLGIHQIRRRASMVLLKSVEDKPMSLMLTTLLRAKMCERVGELLKAKEPNIYFTAGLFSTLDALLDRNMEELIKEMNLSVELHDAVLLNTGQIGEVLKNAIAYCSNQWDGLSDSAIPIAEWRRVYLESFVWAVTSFKQMH